MITTIAIVCAVITMVCAGVTGGLCAYYKHLKKEKVIVVKVKKEENTNE